MEMQANVDRCGVIHVGRKSRKSVLFKNDIFAIGGTWECSIRID